MRLFSMDKKKEDGISAEISNGRYEEKRTNPGTGRPVSPDKAGMEPGARYERARVSAIQRQEKFLKLCMNGSARALRAVIRRTGGQDPLEVVRPPLTDDSEMLHYIDRISFLGDHLSVHGWAWDGSGMHPEILVRGRRKICPARTFWYPREDVNEEEGFPADAESGFTVRLPYADLPEEDILIEFENEFGALPVACHVPRDPEKRAEVYGGPVYARDPLAYDDWFHDHRAGEKRLAAERKKRFPYMPLISICVPLYQTKPEFLDELLQSLLGQTYSRIEICLADGSPDTALETRIKEKAADGRILYQHLAANLGIAGNTNAAMEMASGDFILLADHDDTLEPDAVFEIVRKLNQDHTIDVVYTDEDKLMLSEEMYYSPNVKPDWNPDLLASNNYITHIFCVRRSLAKAVGGECPEFDGAQDYDFIWRCTEQARTIAHVPKILYHWRAHEGSTAGNPESKRYAYEAGRRAIEAHFQRIGIPAQVKRAEDIGSYHTVFPVEGEPLVSIIIPNKDQKAVLKRALDSVFGKTTYRNYEIVIAENNSETDEIFAYYRELEKTHGNVRVVTWDKEFNYSAVNNFAAGHARGEYFLFLNNDVEVISPDWIEEMLGYCQREDVGAVGARLLYPDGSLQHCGVVVGLVGIAGHILQGEDAGKNGYFGRIAKSQDVSAVTGACMMTSKADFAAAGGFDEKLAIAYNDVDYCLKLRKRGKLVVYDAWAELTHYESLSRGSDAAEESPEKHARQMREAAVLKEHFPEIFAKGDPYFNPNLDYYAADYVMAGTAPDSPENKAKREKSETQTK